MKPCTNYKYGTLLRGRPVFDGRKFMIEILDQFCFKALLPDKFSHQLVIPLPLSSRRGLEHFSINSVDLTLRSFIDDYVILKNGKSQSNFSTYNLSFRSKFYSRCCVNTADFITLYYVPFELAYFKVTLHHNQFRLRTKKKPFHRKSMNIYYIYLRSVSLIFSTLLQSVHNCNRQMRKITVHVTVNQETYWDCELWFVCGFVCCGLSKRKFSTIGLLTRMQ